MYGLYSALTAITFTKEAVNFEKTQRKKKELSFRPSRVNFNQTTIKYWELSYQNHEKTTSNGTVTPACQLTEQHAV